MKITTRNIGNSEMVEITYSEDGTTIKETLTRPNEIIELLEEINSLTSDLLWYLSKLNNK
jgi:hypothetical protein